MFLLVGLLLIDGTLRLWLGSPSGLPSVAGAGILWWAMRTVDRYFALHDTSFAQERAVAMREATVTAYKVEYAGKECHLRSLFTGWAMPLYAGDILYLANPSAITSDIDEASFDPEHIDGDPDNEVS